MQEGAKVPLYNLQRLVGKAQSLSLAVPPVGIFLKSSYEALALADRNGEYEITIPYVVHADLRCLRALRSWEIMSSWTQERRSVFRMETDAAMPAWGRAYCTRMGRRTWEVDPSEEGIYTYAYTSRSCWQYNTRWKP